LGVAKYIIIHQKYVQTIIQNSAFAEVSVTLLEAMGRLSHDVGYHPRKRNRG
jgi:hypothetical protein